VDRFSGAATHAAAAEGIEFGGNSGVWALFVFADAERAAVWSGRLKAAFRLLADSGIGGWRTAGWGRSRRPRFREAEAGRLLGQLGWKFAENGERTQWWMLGLFAPGASDTVAWDGGAYRTVMRGGWTASGGAKPELRFVREGSILASETEPGGRVNGTRVAGSAHPVARYGAGLALPWHEESER
jgi:CRISPR type III-A-associated RAMP protein Csm4